MVKKLTNKSFLFLSYFDSNQPISSFWAITPKIIWAPFFNFARFFIFLGLKKKYKKILGQKIFWGPNFDFFGQKNGFCPKNWKNTHFFKIFIFALFLWEKNTLIWYITRQFLIKFDKIFNFLKIQVFKNRPKIALNSKLLKNGSDDFVLTLPKDGPLHS